MSLRFRTSSGSLTKECLDAFLWIGGIFVVWFMLMYGHFRSFVADLWQEEDARPMHTMTLALEETAIRPQQMSAKLVAPAAEDDIVLPDSLSVAAVTERMYSYSLDSYLQERLQDYQLPFSLVPPGKYIRIHRLGVEAPVIDISYATEQQLAKGLFSSELRQGVVRYPFTGQPGDKWNMLLFWHSSVDFREGKKNPYGFVFSKLHELQSGDIIEIVREGKQYLYEVEETVIKQPNKVNEVMQQYQDRSYLTLMACRPLYSASKRILVVAKQMDAQQVAQRLGALN